MGSHCSNCSKCDLGLSESQNEINNQSINYPKGDTNKEESSIINQDYKNRISYYKKNIPKIIFLQLKIKKLLNRNTKDSDQKDKFYEKNYGNYELSNDNLDIISERKEFNSNQADILSRKEENHHQLNCSQEKFKSLTDKYSTLNKNNYNSFEIDVPYKVENYQINESAKYTGYMLNGMQHGDGIQNWEDGARYEGKWIKGKTCGYGIFYHPDGDIYKGYWKDDKANGHGIYTSKNGIKYDGEWLNDCQEGYGEESWNDGSKYKGYYKEGKKHGVGEYLWADGSKYFGNWNNNSQEGFGTYLWNNKRYYEGYFHNNSLHGKGHLKWLDGREYFGSFNKGKKQGLGKYLWADGRSYTGFWENGKQFGLGMYFNEKKEKNFGIWLNGKRNRWLTEEEINALKEENDTYFEQIIHFEIKNYQFIKEKKQLEKNESKISLFH